MAGTGRRLEGMDALRGIAALLVVLLHVEHLARSDVFGGLFDRAYLAVDLFFVLSGYVMARTYEPRMAQGLGALRFGWGRLKRLWPTMFAGALLGLASMWDKEGPVDALLGFAMLALFVPHFAGRLSVFGSNPPAWSILFELFANVAHALALRFMSVRWLLGVCAVSAGVLVAFADNLNVGCFEDGFWLGVPRVMFSYTAGILLWRLRGERAVLPGWVAPVLLPAGIVAAGFGPVASAWPDFAFVFLLAPVLAAGGLSAPPVARRALGFLGTISFPLYAVHFPAAKIVIDAGLGWGWALAAAFLAALVVHFALNPPVRLSRRGVRACTIAPAR